MAKTAQNLQVVLHPEAGGVTFSHAEAHFMIGTTDDPELTRRVVISPLTLTAEQRDDLEAIFLSLLAQAKTDFGV